MVYLFSNVFRPHSPLAFQRAAEERLRPDPANDTMVFFNACVPLLMCRDFFSRFSLLLMRRMGGGVMQGGNGWNEAMYLHPRRMRVLMLDDSGWLYDASFRRMERIPLEPGYPKIFPTSGYFAWRWFTRQRGEETTLVNFYGTSDLSTPMWEGHDYGYENAKMRKEARMVFLDD